MGGLHPSVHIDTKHMMIMIMMMMMISISAATENTAVDQFSDKKEICKLLDACVADNGPT